MSDVRAFRISNFGFSTHPSSSTVTASGTAELQLGICVATHCE